MPIILHVIKESGHQCPACEAPGERFQIRHNMDCYTCPECGNRWIVGDARTVDITRPWETLSAWVRSRNVKVLPGLSYTEVPIEDDPILFFKLIELEARK